MKQVMFLLLSLMLLLGACAKANDPVNNSNNGVEYIKTISTVGDPLDLEISDNLLFSAEDQAGFRVSDKNSGEQIAWVTTYGYMSPLTETKLVKYQKENKFLFIFDREGQDYIAYFDVTDPAHPVFKDKVQGDTNYIIDLQLLPANPADSSFSFYRTGNFGTSYQLKKCDYNRNKPQPTSDVDSLTIRFPYTCGKFDFDVSTNRAYVSARQNGLYCYDALTKSILHSIDTNGEVLDVKVQNGYAYLADRQGGFKIINVSGNFEQIWSFPTPSFATTVTVNTNYAAVAAGTNGTYIFNISDPNKASLKAHLTFAEVGYVNTVLLDGNDIYIASRDKGILKYHIN